MSQISLLTPPLAFAIVLLAALGLSALLSRLAFKPKSRSSQATEPYACGEDIPTHMIQPNYGQFLPFAFFFTILHVVALTIATVPVEAYVTLAFAGLYILGAVVGLSVLYRK
jgi:NADH:ubiquinone oxidoreductase subunit 3 (subunit A)